MHLSNDLTNSNADPMHIPDHMILNQLRESPSVPIEDFAINDSKNVEVDSTKAKAMSP